MHTLLFMYYYLCHPLYIKQHLKLFNGYINPLAPNDMSYRTANLQTLHFKYLLNKYTY